MVVMAYFLQSTVIEVSVYLSENIYHKCSLLFLHLTGISDLLLIEFNFKQLYLNIIMFQFC